MESENEQLQKELHDKAFLLADAILDCENPEKISPELTNRIREVFDAVLDTDNKNYNEFDSIVKYLCQRLNEYKSTPELEVLLEKFMKTLSTPQIQVLHSNFIAFVDDERKKWITKTFEKVLRGRALSEDISNRINHLSGN